jgi:cyclin B
LNQSKDLNESMRNVLLDWLLDIHYRLKMFPSTLFITVSVIDRYLKDNDINKSKLQLVGATALFMAAKY